MILYYDLLEKALHLKMSMLKSAQIIDYYYSYLSVIYVYICIIIFIYIYF